MGLGLFILLAFLLLPLTLSGGWQWWFIEAIVILPMYFVELWSQK